MRLWFIPVMIFLTCRSAWALDAVAAEALVRSSGCLKCHSIDGGKKDGPSYKDVAAKLKGKPDAMARLTKHLTTGPTIKVGDEEEEHKILKIPQAEINNVIEWILSR